MRPMFRFLGLLVAWSLAGTLAASAAAAPCPTVFRSVATTVESYPPAPVDSQVPADFCAPLTIGDLTGQTSPPLNCGGCAFGPSGFGAGTLMAGMTSPVSPCGSQWSGYRAYPTLSYDSVAVPETRQNGRCEPVAPLSDRARELPAWHALHVPAENGAAIAPRTSAPQPDRRATTSRDAASPTFHQAAPMSPQIGPALPQLGSFGRGPVFSGAPRGSSARGPQSH